jgi:nucleoside phosphorylase
VYKRDEAANTKSASALPGLQLCLSSIFRRCYREFDGEIYLNLCFPTAITLCCPMLPKSRNDFTIAIICALPLEAEAVEALFDETYDRFGKYYGKQRGDANAYINGRIGKHDVVLCYMPGMGKGSAASVASSLQVSYTVIDLALVVGICGGAPSPPEYQEIFLGDVIISDSVIEYDFGRQYPGGFQRKTGLKDTLGRLNREIRTLLNGLRAENARKELENQTQQYLHTLQQTGTKWHHPMINDILYQASYFHKHSDHVSTAGCSCFGSDLPDQICEEALEKDCDNLGCDKSQQARCREISEDIRTSIYIGAVASADTVMKSGQHRDELARKEKVIGFEMEGAGVWDNIPCIIIKGVCDYADSHKSKLWQAYAAATGASAAKAFLECWMPANHKG